MYPNHGGWRCAVRKRELMARYRDANRKKLNQYARDVYHDPANAHRTLNKLIGAQLLKHRRRLATFNQEAARGEVQTQVRGGDGVERRAARREREAAA